MPGKKWLKQSLRRVNRYARAGILIISLKPIKVSHLNPLTLVLEEQIPFDMDLRHRNIL
jgi:hypothetical protein